MADQTSIILNAEVRIDESKLQQSLNRIEKNFKFNSPFSSANGELNQFDKSLASANQRVLTFGASIAVLASGIKIFKDIVSATAEVEAAFIDINSIFNLSRESLDKFSKGLFDVARNTSQSFATAADAAKEFSRQGLSAEETLKRTRDALILTRLSNLDAAASVNVLTAAVNGFQKSGLNTTDILNKFVAVDQNFAVSVSDLAQGFARAGASASDAGVSVNDLIGLITAAQQTTARGGAVIGNALKTIFTRVQRGSILDDFEALGVKIKDSQGYLLPTIDILKNFAQTYDKLSGSIKRQAAELVGGVYQINIFKAAIQDLSKVNGVFAQSSKVAENAQDQALKRNTLLNDSYKALGEQVATTNKQIFANIGSQAIGSVVKPIIKLGLNNPIVDALKDASGEASTYGGIFAQGLLKGIGNALVIGLGPILLAAGAQIVKRTLGNVGNSVLLESGIKRNQAQTTEAGKTVDQYVRGNQVLQQQITSFDALNSSAAKFAAIMTSIANIKLPSIGGLTAADSPLVGRVLNGETLHNLQVQALRPKILGNVAQELNPNVAFPNSRSLAGIQRSLYSSVSTQYDPERAALKERLIASHPGINTGGSTLTPLSLLSGTPAAEQEIARLGREADGLINQAIKDTVDRKLKEIKQQTQFQLGNITGLSKFNARESLASSLAQQEREELGLNQYRLDRVTSSRGRSFFGTQSGDDAAIRSEFGGRQLGGSARVTALAQIRAQRINTRQNVALGTSFIAPLLAGAIPQGTSGTAGGILGGAGSGALNGAGIGASIGTFFPEIAPFTIAAGAFIGGMTGALSKLHKSFEELVQEHVDNNQKTEEELNAAQSIFQKIDEFRAATNIKDPNDKKAATDRITEDINDTFNTKIFDKKLRAIITNLLNNPSEENEEAQGKLLGTQASRQISKQNRGLTAFQSVQEFIQKSEKIGHYESTGEFGSGTRGREFVTDGFKGPENSNKLAASVASLLPNVPQTQNTLKAIISGAGGGSQKEGLENILKSGGVTDAEIKNLGLTDDLAKAFLQKVLELFQTQSPGGPAGKLGSLIKPVEDPRVKKAEGLSAFVVGQEQLAAEIKASAESNLKISQNFQRILGSRSNTSLGRIQQQSNFEDINLTSAYQASVAETIASGKAKLFAATKGHENDAVNAEISKVDVNNPATIDALLKLAVGDEKGTKLGGAATEEFIKAVRELKKSTDDLNSTYKKNKNTLRAITGQNLEEEQNVGNPVLALRANSDAIKDARKNLDDASSRGDSKEKIRDLGTTLDLLIIELDRRLGALGQGGKTQKESDIARGIRLNQTEDDNITQFGQSALDIARDRAARFKSNQFTSGDQVQSTQFDVARLQGIQGDALGSFKTGFSSVVEKFKKDTDQMADIGKNLADSLSSNLGNAFGDFITGAKSGKDAFKSFITSVLSDAARAFASKAVQTLLGAFSTGIGDLFSGSSGASPTHGAQGGRFGFASGGLVPSLLMGGEFVVGPNAAKKIGYTTLQKLNRYAEGGYVGGGSGTQDDVPASLPSGSFVLRKSAVQKLGPNYLNALVGGGMQQRDLGGGIWGALLGAVIGGGVGYLAGGKKGALIGAGVGAIGGGLYGYNHFGNNSGAGSVTSAQGSGVGLDGFTGAGGHSLGDGSTIAGAAGNSLSPIQKALFEAGAAGVLGIAGALLNKKKGEPGAISNSDVPAYASNIENTQLAYLASAGAGKYPYLQANPQGGYSLAGFGDAPATRRFAGGGGVNTPIVAGDGGNGAPQVNIKIDINNNGTTSSSGTSNNKDGAFGESFADKLQKQVRSIVTEELIRQSRSDGILAKGNPLGTRAG